ncbi:protein ZNRD2 [Trichomycterus rosablanca]|uniref:protein ZNRD2 n=1 Tax=Trichomycterus rosablanca TaxID=2290929 RepID=UPI002F351B0A
MALNGDDEDLGWEPPSEAEMKVLQARRERQDKISKLMGDYLLKGYKMLGECCDACGTILLQDKQKKNYCVACQELDSDIDKDNPALNAQAALSQVRERQLANHHQSDGTTPTSTEAPPSSRPEHCEGAASGLRAPPPPPVQPRPLPAPSALPPQPSQSPPAVLSSASLQPRPAPPPPPPPPPPHQQAALSQAEEAVLHKLRWATQQLQDATSTECSVQLCSLIRSCAETLRSLRELQP